MSRRCIVPSKVPKCLVCPICMSLMVNPARTDCAHTFCRSCIQSHVKSSNNRALCPICRTAVQVRQLGQDRIAKLAIDDVNVVCMNKDCCWTGRLGDGPGHESVCMFRPDRIDPSIAKMMPDKTIGEEEDLNEKLTMSLISEIYVSHPEVVKEVFGSGKNRVKLELFTLNSD